MVLNHNINTILIGPALYDQVLAEESGKATNKRILEYSKATEKVAKKYNVPFIDLWIAFKEATPYTEEQRLSDTCNLDSLLRDGVHYDGNGYKVFTKS